MKSIKKYLLIAAFGIAAVITSNQNSLAQVLSCDPSPGCTDPWVTATNPLVVNIGERCSYSVNYQTRTCNGVIEMRLLLPGTPIDITNCPGFDPADISWFAAMEMLNQVTSNPNVTIPACVETSGGGGIETGGGGGNIDPNAMVRSIRVLTAACTFTKECTTTFDRVTSTNCNYGLPTSESYTLTETHVEELPCGTACCIRTYKFCRKTNGEIVMIQDGVQLLGTCSNEGTYSPETCDFQCDN
jgi:hypothetical protein